MNQNTRALYDEISVKNRAIISQQPIRYIAEPTSKYRTYVSPIPENIDESSKLRMQPTRLNYFNRPETELYGTAPYTTRSHRGLVDVESQLFFGSTHNHCDRIKTEKAWDVIDPVLDLPLKVDSELRPRDTQADLRNSYCNSKSMKNYM